MTQGAKFVDLNEVRRQLNASPPPPPAGTSVREWFAGLALLNPTLMEGIPPELRPAEAVRLSDQMVKALATPRAPNLDSMKAPSDEELQMWEQKLVDQKERIERRERETVMDKYPRMPSKKPTLRFNGALPSPAFMPPAPKDAMSQRARPMTDTRYIIREEIVETVRPGRRQVSR